MSFEAVRQMYEQRDQVTPEDWHLNRYHPRHPLGRLFAAHNREVLTDALNVCEIDLEPLRILDVGCGTGFWLRQLVDLGAAPERLTGIDLSPDRLAIASAKNPGINWIETAGDLPFEEEAFDLVMQTVVFSSIPDESLRRELAAEMNRVTRPGGRILWVDLKPDKSENLVTFSRETVRSYFPASTLSYERPIHPRYFRRFYGHPGPLAALYRLTQAFCEAWLLLFTKRP